MKRRLGKGGGRTVAGPRALERSTPRVGRLWRVLTRRSRPTRRPNRFQRPGTTGGDGTQPYPASRSNDREPGAMALTPYPASRFSRATGNDGGRPRSTAWRVPLPAVVGERLVRLRHAEDVVLALVRAALLALRIEQLVGEPLRHRLLAAGARERHQPAHGERARARRGHLDRHLVGRAADAPRLHLEDGCERLDRRLERLDGVAPRALGEDRQRVVDDALGGRLLAVEHHSVDDLLDELGAVDRIGLDRALRGGSAAGHRYLAFTPYCERAFLRSETPAASSVPRTTL